MKQIILVFLVAWLHQYFLIQAEKFGMGRFVRCNGWILYIFVLNTTGDAVLSVFAGSLAIGMYSEIMARILKTPATIYSLSEYFLCAGVPAYNTIEYLVKTI